MGKIKSAIITALLLAAILVLSLFATISCDVPGTNHVSRYNSFLSSIRLGSDLTGEAYALLYPDGVISVSDYNLVVEDEDSEDREEYKNKYVLKEGVYVDKAKLENEEEFKASIAADAKIISKRFGEKNYTKYSVSVEDDCSFVIRVAVPTGFSAAAFNEYDTNLRSTALTEIGNTVQTLIVDGGMSLRDGTDYDTSKSLININDDFGEFFKSVSYFKQSGQHAVRMDLTDEGFEKLNNVLTSSSEGTAYIFAGERSLGLQMDMGADKALEAKTLLFTPDQSYATDFAVILSSIVNGDVVSNSYNNDPAGSGTVVIAATPVFGDYAPVYLLVAMLLALIAVIVVSVVRYKNLGWVHAIISVMYALVMVLAILLIPIQLTIAGAFVVCLGLALLTFSNFHIFEAVRKETKLGRTIQASVKSGYKNTIATMLDLHIVLIVVSAMMALICVGELAACGLIFFVASIASYVLCWFTRFMWYVISSMAKDKFKFCGYAREVSEDVD